ncbi:dehydrogenase [Sphingomonas sp. DBB INV C78]|uniref:SDR family NAD(P)-dependent oxidoreductase n=1 Tax=Sphingomonas sp. DBB INV C78 TaxID=3349434 RepID=UPI0036D40031
MKGLSGRVAVITGASSGIGAAIARRLEENNVRIVAVDRNPAGLTGAATLAIDVSASDAPARIAALAEEAGGCDILVNAAGISAFGLFDDEQSTLWDDTLRINVDAVARITRALLPQLRASDQGRIIMIGSTCSQFASAGLSAYVVSKHAILGLTRALAAELGKDGITVNCIQPGAILTGITGPVFEQDPSYRTYWENKASLGRVGTPEDVAPLAAFLASEEARFITGHGIYADGGAMQQN